MVRFWTPPGLHVSLGVVTERLDADAVIAELGRAYRAGDQRPGQDCLTLIDPGIDMSEVSVTDLFRIQQASAAYNRMAPVWTVPRSVFVFGRGASRVGTEIYVELWNHLPGPRPEFQLCEGFAEANVALGTRDLGRYFRGLLMAEPFLR